MLRPEGTLLAWSPQDIWRLGSGVRDPGLAPGIWSQWSGVWDLGAGTGFSPRGWAQSVGGDRAGGVADGSTETGKDGDQGRALTRVVTS